MRSPRRLVGSAALCAGMVMIAAGLPTAAAQTGPVPSLKLVAIDDTLELLRYDGRVPLDLRVFVGAQGGDFELHVTRPDYAAMQVQQVDSETHSVLRTLPSDVLFKRWRGLADFVEVTFTDADGVDVASKLLRFCPNNWRSQRLDDQGPTTSDYAESCRGGFPFLKGFVWGINDHWASPVTSEYGSPRVRVPAGNYTVEVEIADRYRELFEIDDAAGRVTLSARVRNARSHHVGAERLAAANSEEQAAQTSAGALPTTTSPAPETMPDLVALPTWRVDLDRRGERDVLGFASTPWNAGPAPMVVEGFRRANEDVMDTYQYFYNAAGEPVSRAAVGLMDYDTRRGHHHWHFRQFARFSLLDLDENKIVRSKKQSFCLVPTDAVDLTLPGADPAPYGVGVFSVCGGPDALWIRETLPAGWGDTYYQSAGQAFNVTNLPNGWYQLQVEVNPLGLLYERSMDNNSELRLVRLHGKGENRQVTVAPWNGINR